MGFFGKGPEPEKEPDAVQLLQAVVADYLRAAVARVTAAIAVGVGVGIVLGVGVVGLVYAAVNSL